MDVKRIMKKTKRILKNLKNKLYNLTRVKAVEIVDFERFTSEMIFDFTDVERLCYNYVTVKIPGKKGPESYKCFVRDLSVSNAEDNSNRFIDVKFEETHVLF